MVMMRQLCSICQSVVVSFRFLIPLSIIAFAVSVEASSSVRLTKNNFHGLTRNKTVFIKWFVPSCGHCQELAPHWDEMAQEWIHRSQETSLVAEVDCAENQIFCTQWGIAATPTIQYGEVSHGGIFLQEYAGEKTYRALSQFANETLGKPFCSPGNLPACEPTVKDQLQKYWDISIADLEEEIRASEQQIHEAEQSFELHFRTLREEYYVANQNFQEAIVPIKRQLKFLSNVNLAHNEFNNQSENL